MTVEPTIGRVRPTPTDDEVAAIAAAVAELWPTHQASHRAEPTSNRWRFSGRWWADPVVTTRRRP